MLNDTIMLEKSKIVRRLKAMNARLGTHFYLFGDCGYQPQRYLLTPKPKTARLQPWEKKFNRRMSKVRVSVEWMFGKVTNLWATVDFRKNLKLYKQPVGAIYLIAALLTNCHSCLYGNQAARYFDVPTPDLEDYLS